MIVLRNLQTINTLIILIAMTLCVVFMIQVKDIYTKNQKYHRYLGYKQYITEISVGLNEAEKTVNKSSTYVHQLSEAIMKHEKENRLNSTSPRVTFPL